MTMNLLIVVATGFAAFLLIDLGCFFWLRSLEASRQVYARSAHRYGRSNSNRRH